MTSPIPEGLNPVSPFFRGEIDLGWIDEAELKPGVPTSSFGKESVTEASEISLHGTDKAHDLLGRVEGQGFGKAGSPLEPVVEVQSGVESVGIEHGLVQGDFEPVLPLKVVAPVVDQGYPFSDDLNVASVRSLECMYPYPCLHDGPNVTRKRPRAWVKKQVNVGGRGIPDDQDSSVSETPLFSVRWEMGRGIFRNLLDEGSYGGQATPGTDPRQRPPEHGQSPCPKKSSICSFKVRC